MNEPRLLRADEISCRVQQVTKNNGAIILLYKDARVDMNILDETFGAMNWQRSHIAVDGNLHCVISVWDEDKKQWVSKQDVGTESFTEATKGEASDSFKRAGFNWGIGRELYTAPFIFVPLKDGEFEDDRGRSRTTFRFGLTVKEIGYTNTREINRLVIVDKQGNVRFTLGQKVEEPEIEKPKPKEPVKVTVKQPDDEIKRRGKEIKDLYTEFGFSDKDYAGDASILKAKSPREMTLSEFVDHMADLRKHLEERAKRTA